MGAMRFAIPLLVAGLSGAAWAAPKGAARSEAKAPDRVAALEQRLERLEAELARRPRDISAYSLPEKLELCGQTIDLTNPDVRERMEHAFYLMLGDRAQVVLWTKRARRFFPVVDAETKRQNVCRDVRYLAVIESGLRPGVTSHASAHGWWQFMSATGRAYGLDIDGHWDERADLEASTRASVRYLSDLHRQFGDWHLAFAAYNTGPGRLQNAIEAQGAKDFWRLDLITEAERYVPRMAAAKVILENLEHYGFAIDVDDGWAPEPVAAVEVEVPGGRQGILDVARRSGIDYRDLRRLNPELGGDALPSGRTIVLEVPKGKEASLRAAIANGEARGERREPSRTAKRADSPKGTSAKAKHYTVRAGDSLWGIAKAHSVSIDELRRWNGLGRKDALKAGQRIVVKR